MNKSAQSVEIMSNTMPILGVPQNVFECLDAYKYRCQTNEFSLVQSSIFRFTLPGLGLASPKGQRLTTDEMESCRIFCKKMPLAKLAKFPEAQEKTFEVLNTSKDQQRSNRSRLKKFLNWVAEQNWVQTEQLDDQNQIYRFSGEKHERIQRQRLTNRPNNTLEKFSLSFDVSDYLDKSSDLSEEDIKVHLEKIANEIKDFEAYMRAHGYKPYTIEVRTKGVQRFLGWLYLANHIPLQELSLTSLIEVVKLKYSLADFTEYSQYIYAKGLAHEQAREIANLVVKRLDDFFQWLNNPPSASTKAIYTETAISIAKYLYRYETDKDYAAECHDIPIVRRLRVYCNKFEEHRRTANNTVVPFHKKAVTWEQVLMVLEKLRYEATATHWVAKTILDNGQFKRKIRPIQARAASFMKFLLLAMFTLMPPDRQRTFRELRLGETLKHGTFQGELFIPKDRMLDPSKAKYYIHLLPEDYKTGKSYGEWVGEIPNTIFSDDSTFYQYLDEWLYGEIKTKNGIVKGLRNVLNPENHNYIFFGRITSEPIKIECLTAKIRHIFERHTRVPVTPHTLRKIFRTYIKENGVSPEEEESAAFWMKHDLRTANKHYTFLNCQSKLRAGSVLANRLNSSIFEKLKARNFFDEIVKETFVEEKEDGLDEIEGSQPILKANKRSLLPKSQQNQHLATNDVQDSGRKIKRNKQRTSKTADNLSENQINDKAGHSEQISSRSGNSASKQSWSQLSLF
jgi:hypothetical protein